jgi:MFS family permease
MWFSRLAVDVTPLRESRDFRLLTAGSLVTGLGTQATLIALPYQVYVTTGSAFLTGLLGAAELGPLIVASLFGGALADRFDRRTMLLFCQLALVALAAALALAAYEGSPAVWLLFGLAGLTAGASSVERVVRAAIVPNVVRPEQLRAGLATTYGLYQLTQVVGPGVGGLLIAGFGIGTPYAVDAVSCLGMAAAAAAMSAQPPLGSEKHEPVLRSIRSGLSFVFRLKALLGSFVIDLSAMTFGMPRALFPVLSVSVFGAGAAGAGLLTGTVAALTSAQFSVVSGGLACLASVGVIALAFPQLAAYDGEQVGAGAVGAEDAAGQVSGA